MSMRLRIGDYDSVRSALNTLTATEVEDNEDFLYGDEMAGT